MCLKCSVSIVIRFLVINRKCLQAELNKAAAGNVSAESDGKTSNDKKDTDDKKHHSLLLQVKCVSNICVFVWCQKI